MSHRHPFHYALLGICLAHIIYVAWTQFGFLSGIEGLLYADGTPVGGDFINLWSAGRLVLEGRAEFVYEPSAFMDYEIGLTGAPIGVRLWAYPPHSLLVLWPFALVDFYYSLLAWSLLGLGVLAWGCRRFGLSGVETLIVVFSPASVLCLVYGQTGNLATGLLLLALAATSHNNVTRSTAAGLLTTKPQIGFLLPVLWSVERRWAAIATTAALFFMLAGISFLIVGVSGWGDYLSKTLPLLSDLERHGSGPFMSMVVSMFMGLRIVTGDGDLALQMHLVLAIPILSYAIWKMGHVSDPVRRAAVLLMATALISPYLHNYDLAVIAVAALLVLRRFAPDRRGELAVCLVVAAGIALPQLVAGFNTLGIPISPLVMLPLLLLA